MNESKVCFTPALLLTGIIACLLMASGHCHAEKNYFDISESEMRMLPPFCRDRLKSVPGLSRDDYVHSNHICPGLNALNDARRQFNNPQQKTFALNAAVNNFSYTLSHTSDAHPFRSTIFVKRGNAYELQGKTQLAVSDYQAAIRNKPQNLHAYLALSNAYLKLNNSKDAVAVLDQGLKIAPNNQVLLKKKQDILAKR